MTGKKLILALGVGIPLLLGLNIRRDYHQLSDALDWSPVKRGVLNRSVSSPGIIQAVNLQTITSQVSEKVVQVLVKEGQKVKKDQSLMKLSRTTTQIEYEQKRNARDEARSSYKKAQQELKIQKKLLRSDAVPKSQVQEARRSLSKAKASLNIRDKEFQITAAKYLSTHVKSPINGVVLKIHKLSGAYISSGKELITVGDISKFKVHSEIDELDIRLVKVGQPVHIKVDAYPDQIMKGKVLSIAVQADRKAFAQLAVIISLQKNKAVPLRHNLSCQVNILTEKIQDATSIPVKAVQKKTGDTAWVYVKNKMNLVRRRKIQLGQPAGDEVEVLSGLQEGEEVGIVLPRGDFE